MDNTNSTISNNFPLKNCPYKLFKYPSKPYSFYGQAGLQIEDYLRKNGFSPIELTLENFELNPNLYGSYVKIGSPTYVVELVFCPQAVTLALEFLHRCGIEESFITMNWAYQCLELQ